MDQQQQRIAEDLAGVIEGELRFDGLTLELYSSDASLYQLRPLGVVYPRGRDDVVHLARYAQEHDLPLVPRGSGSGVAGGALGRGLVIDFSRHMTEIEHVTDQHVRVQAGVVRDRLNERLLDALGDTPERNRLRPRPPQDAGAAPGAYFEGKHYAAQGHLARMGNYYRWILDNFDGAIGKRSCFDVIPVRRCPLRIESGRSTPRRSLSFGL